MRTSPASNVREAGPLLPPSSPKVWGKRSRRRARHEASAFTLIEMIVVTLIISMMAALVVPNVVAFKKSRDLKDTEAKIARLPLEARNEAAKSGRPVTLRFDGEDLVMSREPAPGAAAAAAAGSSTTSSKPSSLNSSDSSQDDVTTEQDVKRLPLGSSISTAGNIDVTPESAMIVPSANPSAAISSSGAAGTASAGGTTDVASWRWTVYPDGSQDGGGITFRVGSGEMSLLIPSDGSAPRWVQGSMPPAEDEKWPAGDLLRRS